MRNFTSFFIAILLGAALLCPLLARAGDDEGGMRADIAYFAGLGDRSTGSEGCEKAADYILDAFQKAGLTEVGFQQFLQPVPKVISASITVGEGSVKLYPWGPNMAYLPMTPEEGLTGPLIYAGDGRPDRFDGLPVGGSIVLMDMASYDNWMNAAMFGASALIFIGDERSGREAFDEKDTPTPVAFPRFWVAPSEGELLKRLALGNGGAAAPQAVVHSKTRWQDELVRNCYAFVPGKSKTLGEEMVVIEAPYDASSYVLGIAPGADESTSAAMLLRLAREFGRNPPERSVLLMATAGGGQSLAGMREFMWAATERKKNMKEAKRILSGRKEALDHALDVLKDGADAFALDSPEDRALIWKIASEKAKDVADDLTREAMRRRVMEMRKDVAGTTVSGGDSAKGEDAAPSGEIVDARHYRRMAWRSSLDELTPEERVLTRELLKGVTADLKAEGKELKKRRQALESSIRLRSLAGERQAVLYVSLRLSSRAPVLGLMEQGDSYPLREQIRRQVRASRLEDRVAGLAQEVARETGLRNILKSGSRSGTSSEGFEGGPMTGCLGCDVASLAGSPAVALAGIGCDHHLWGTPFDVDEHVNGENIGLISAFLPPLLRRVCSLNGLGGLCQAGFGGWASLEGSAMFLRQGELFPDQPAPGTIISIIQGDNVFRAMTHRDGSFTIHGLANGKVALEKLILEPYGIDASTGRVAWTADKVQTGKENYRIKVKGKTASTALTMFRCAQTDVVGAFQPQKMGVLTKVDLLDAATDARPMRYWYSRVDGRDTMAISVFLEPGTAFKLILSEGLLQKEFILLHGSPDDPNGRGYLIGEPPSIELTPYRAAEDMRFLIGERLGNLHRCGIINRRLETLYGESSAQLDSAMLNLEQGRYGKFWEDVVEAWAKLVVVYTEIGDTQRDVLLGVMFFIALFVPFSYVVERFLFCHRNIYRQIITFLIVLLLTIFVIRGLHPAFQLTYSPMVVIIAFFIVGLSLLVSAIIFMRFEAEMVHAQGHGAHGAYAQANKWQAFGAGFTIGASNLNRRKLRTGLTCATLVILTFTVMSFTNVKSLRIVTDTRIADAAPYKGILLHHPLWLPLTLMTLEDMRVRFPAGEGKVFPRGWVDAPRTGGRSIATVHRVRPDGSLLAVGVEGVLGLGEDPPENFRMIVTHGSWLPKDDRDAILLPTALAARLGLDPEKDVGTPVHLWGRSCRVVGYFDENALSKMVDLDGKPVTPGYMEISQEEDLSEVEVEAMQSGEVVLPATERLRYANAGSTVITSFDACLEHDGDLKAISVSPPPSETPMQAAQKLSSWLAFPLFVGDGGGVWFHSSGSSLRYQGVTNLFIPILIVVFICLNTMIGHVQERQKEISIYTSVGLAPWHVGFLFIVEAMSLAALSTVIGYILAQLSAKYLGSTAMFADLTFNYSSLAGVACMALVFSVVFLASLYPARLAARMAMPDVNRTWDLPEPEGDSLSLNLPFLLKYDEERGVIGFLNSFFADHEDSSHGKFTANGIEMDRDAPVLNAHLLANPTCVYMRTNVWLAPFDFGIKQRVQLHCCPSEEDPGYMEIYIRMLRLSGERSAWVRANRTFVKELRKRMLLWRLLRDEDKAHYSELVSI
ncbi:MAG: FtsX-like permease family protein [Syntrophobacteraceae bacterium]